MKLKQQTRKIVIATILFGLGMICPWKEGHLLLLAAAYILSGAEIVRKAWRNLGKRQLFDENFLMTVATFGAIALEQYSEAAAVMLFYQIGELFQAHAVAKSRKSVAELMNIRPDYANLRQKDEIVKVAPEEVKIGDIIVVSAGEKIPLDGVIVKGSSLVDTAAITGEPVPRDVTKGDEISSGFVNISGVLEIKVTKVLAESTVSKILNLVENSSAKKAQTELFISKFARYYTPLVVWGAVALAVIPPLWNGYGWNIWIYRALTFLVISCPCALVISVPLSFFGGIGAASRQGVLIKGGEYLQLLNEVKTVVFDKTGTLTKGSFKVVKIKSLTLPTAELLELAAYAGAFSVHPVSQSIRQALGKKISEKEIASFEEIAGKGVQAIVKGRKVAVGNKKLMQLCGVKFPQNPLAGTVVHVAVDGEASGWIMIADEIKKDAPQAIAELKKQGVTQTVMLSGDRKSAAEAVAEAVGIDKVYSELLPNQKVEQVENLMNTNSGKLAYVGDGLNDAPVLARADVGIAMGGLGTDAAVEAADIVIMTDEPYKAAVAMKIARKTLRIVKQNIVFALGVKFAVLGMGAYGLATMWEAVFADVGVSVLAILNALRVLYYREK